ncbi:MAG: hypothetical protein AB7I30_12325 [Isosphaeraceae bacterium]
MASRALTGLVLILILAMLPATSSGRDGNEEPAAPTPVEVFERRIMPIFRSPQPASCVQCHLAAVDLKDYILPSHEQTFASLRDQGLIDLDDPANSKILTLIRMGEKDLDKGARLIHQKTREAEYEAFAAWIHACCDDPKMRALARLSVAELARPARPDPVIRHARKSRVVDSFVRNVWSQRMRCFPCHTPHEIDESNPNHKTAIEKHKEFLETHGIDVGRRMNIFRETPEATVDYLIERSRETPEGSLPLINLTDPQKSLIVLKPTSKLPARDEDGNFAKPSYGEPVSHMGGLKMHVDDPSYKAFIAWIQDYARVVGDQYTSVADLPPDNWHPTKHVLMVRQVPDSLPVGTRMQLFLHAWDAQANAWSSERIAFTQGQITPVRNVVGTLFLFGPSGSPTTKTPEQETARLAPGKYLIKAYVDDEHRLAENPTLFLGDEDFLGQAEIDARWGEGFPAAEKILGRLLMK